jgi:hypothetical protein
MKLLYGTTTQLMVMITDLYYDSRYRLYLTEEFNMWPRNPPSSNPFQLFVDFREMVRTNDLANPKYIAHRRALRSRIRATPNPSFHRSALSTIDSMGIHGVQPYLAILEVETYLHHHYPQGGMTLDAFRVSPPNAGSPTSVEYVFDDIRGPRHHDAELHLQKLFF